MSMSAYTETWQDEFEKNKRNAQNALQKVKAYESSRKLYPLRIDERTVILVDKSKNTKEYADAYRKKISSTYT